MTTSLNVDVIKMPGDGDCLYHAFIRGANLSGKASPNDLRLHVADKIRTVEDLYDDLLREWIDFGIIRKDGDGFRFVTTGEQVTPETAAYHIVHTKDWATSTVIHILASSMNLDVYVTQLINGQQYTETFPSPWKNRMEPQRHRGKARERGGRGKLGDRGNRGKLYLYRTQHHFDLLVPRRESVEPVGFAITSSAWQLVALTVVFATLLSGL
jgi:hypothetical protein